MAQITQCQSRDIMYTFAMHTLLTLINTPPLNLILPTLFLCLPVSAWGDDRTVDEPEPRAVQRSAEANADKGLAEAVPHAGARIRPQRFGWREKIILSPELRWELDAKLDTGADTSSLDARNIRRVRFKGKRYVRFSIEDPESGEVVSLRRPYVRTVRIRRHDGDHQRRYVVLMSICLGSEQRTIEVTLTDRDVFDNPMLLGRSALEGLAIVDPQVTHTTHPSCGVVAPDDADFAQSETTKDRNSINVNTERGTDGFP